MKYFGTATLATIGLIGTVGAASAGGNLRGGSIKDAPAPAPVAHECVGGAFSGPYIGIQGGWVGADAEQLSLNNGTRVSSEDDGWSIGGHVGYNRQCGRLLLGIEADLNYADIESSGSVAGQTLTSSIDYFGTLRGRAGLVNDNILFYLTGGLAFAHVDHELNFPAQTFSQSDGDTKWGWTIGGGIELQRGHWSLRAEVLYVDLEDATHRYTFTGPCIVCTADVRWEDDFVVGRIGLSFKLHRDEPQHVPLK